MRKPAQIILLVLTVLFLGGTAYFYQKYQKSSSDYASMVTQEQTSRNQYGEAIKVSDVLNWTDLFHTLDIGIKSMGEDAALHADTVIRNELVASITGAGNRR